MCLQKMQQKNLKTDPKYVHEAVPSKKVRLLDLYVDPNKVCVVWSTHPV